MVLDTYLGNVKWKTKNNALYYEKSINNEKYIFIKPLTFMNLSGEAVIKYVNYYNVDINFLDKNAVREMRRKGVFG